MLSEREEGKGCIEPGMSAENRLSGILEPPTKDFTPRRKQKLFSEAMPENLRQLSMLEEKIRIAL